MFNVQGVTDSDKPTILAYFNYLFWFCSLQPHDYIAYT